MVQAHGENKAHLLALGFGYSARALAGQLGPTWEVIGTSTRGGDDTLMFDGAFASPELETAFTQADAVLISIPPDAHGCPAFRAFADTPCTARWIGYLSTTGVYGDRDGRWCFEWTPPRPSSAVSANRVTAEKQWASRGGHAFRLAGIYGPGRSALDRVRDGAARRVVKPGQVFSRIHVADIAAALACSLARPDAKARSICATTTPPRRRMCSATPQRCSTWNCRRLWIGWRPGFRRRRCASIRTIAASRMRAPKPALGGVPFIPVIATGSRPC
jgi:hypothetical protein